MILLLWLWGTSWLIFSAFAANSFDSQEIKSVTTHILELEIYIECGQAL